MMYIVQLIAMMCDLLFFAAFGFTVYHFSRPFAPFFILIALLALLVWVKYGSFSPWYPPHIRRFFRNARRYGL